MAKSKFINYFAYTNLYNVNNCSINSSQGKIDFKQHLTQQTAKIEFILMYGDGGVYMDDKYETRTKYLRNITKDENSVYTFSAKKFPEDPRDLQNFQYFQIKISEDASITFNNNDHILEYALLEQDNNNIFFRFSYDVNDENCHQFDNCILYIEQDDSSNYTYTNWISPIACGNDIKSYIKGITSTTLFDGSLNKCIKATSSSKWISAFEKRYSTTTIYKGNYRGNIKSSPSKDYEYGNLVRFQDIDLTSITDQETNIENPGTPVTPKV